MMPAMQLPPRSRSLTAILGALSALPSLSVDIGLPAAPAVAIGLAVSPGDVQATLSGFLVGFAIGQLAHGAVADRLGRRPALLAGLALFVAAGAVCAATRSLAVLVAMRGLQGVGACAGVVVARAMIRDMFEPSAGVRNQSILSLASNLGTLIGPVLGGLLVTRAGFRAVYGVLPAVGALVLAVCARWLPETRPPAASGRAPRLGYRHVVTQWRVIAPALCNGVVFAGLFACIAAAPQLLLGQFGVSPAGLGGFFALAALASLAGSGLNHALLPRSSPSRLSALGLALIGVATLALGAAACATPRIELVAGAILLDMFACGIVMPNAISAAMSPLPRLAGTVAAVIGCVQAGFGAAAVALVGLASGSLAGLGAVVASFSLPGIALGAAVLTGPSPRRALHACATGGQP